ncbi:hypothetical protein FGO68_gene7546 [Halteria grandinella]|uniref:Uncharacterized protein n=1 Tax=Halteria grandinella TaxID=5974 RepID=A0A8J8T7J3_HALGN|nr:hypothetical protein FGO68_gene7546 [Halteria grandinella]
MSVSELQAYLDGPSKNTRSKNLMADFKMPYDIEKSNSYSEEQDPKEQSMASTMCSTPSQFSTTAIKDRGSRGYHDNIYKDIIAILLHLSCSMRQKLQVAKGIKVDHAFKHILRQFRGQVKTLFVDELRKLGVYVPIASSTLNDWKLAVRTFLKHYLLKRNPHIREQVCMLLLVRSSYRQPSYTELEKSKPEDAFIIELAQKESVFSWIFKENQHQLREQFFESIIVKQLWMELMVIEDAQSTLKIYDSKKLNKNVSKLKKLINLCTLCNALEDLQVKYKMIPLGKEYLDIMKLVIKQ